MNREAWIRYAKEGFYIKAGRMFVPFGWRLEDNTAFVRQLSGINMLQGDDGIELGWERGSLQTQLAVTNGAGGGSERDDGKQFSGRFMTVNRGWQLGVSVLDNNTDTVDRQAYGIFAGARTGPVAWLFEYDRIEDQAPGTADTELDVALLEANWQPARGHNVKATIESIDFDGSVEEQQRFSLLYELTPLPFVQLRFGVRERTSDDPNPFFDSSEAFVELHGFL